jgi:hypothetical protein
MRLRHLDLGDGLGSITNFMGLGTFDDQS